MVDRESTISLNGVWASYGGFVALRDVNVDIIEPGIYGILGPNGSGKTTMIKVMLGIKKALRGRVSILGKEPDHKEIRSRIGYMCENGGLIGGMKVHDYLCYILGHYSDDYAWIGERASWALEKVELTDWKNKPVRTLSKGMKQRLNFARSILHQPDVLILDEPLSGLDPLWRSKITDSISDMADRGVTVFLSSHELNDIDGLCDTLILIRKGKLIRTGTPGDMLKKRIGSAEYLFHIESRRNVVAKIPEVFPEVSNFSLRKEILRFNAPAGTDAEKKILKYLLDNEVEFSVRSRELSSVYLGLIEEGDDDG